MSRSKEDSKAAHEPESQILFDSPNDGKGHCSALALNIERGESSPSLDRDTAGPYPGVRPEGMTSGGLHVPIREDSEI